MAKWNYEFEIPSDQFVSYGTYEIVLMPELMLWLLANEIPYETRYDIVLDSTKTVLTGIISLDTEADAIAYKIKWL